MKLMNARNGFQITKNAKMCTSFWDRFLGLINPNNPRFLVFKTRFGIHTLFLNKNIDILVLDRSNRVVKLKIALKPFCFYFYSPQYESVVELAGGTILKADIKVDDKILFE